MEHKNQQLDEFAPPVDATSVEPSAGLLPAGEVDKEGAMAKADLYKLSNYSYKLFKKIQDDDQLESWVQAKITKAADYIASVYHYLEYEMKFSEYGAKLENSEMYTESEKAEIRNKLNEAKETIRALKIAQAEKLSEGKSPKAKKDWDKDGEIESEKDEVIGSRRKAAGLDKKEECMKEEQLDELDKSTLKSYTKAASQDIADKSTKLAKTDSSKKQAELTKKIVNRQQGIKQAVDKMEEAAPSADLTKKEKSAVVKKAKAGKDIGKPGKGFEKVASKAAKKYGSKEKGEKVAAAAMWKNIKESVEHSFGEGVYGSDEPQTEDFASDISKLNKPEKFAPVKPQNIKADRMADQGYPDLDQGSIGAKPVEQTVADLQKTHPKLYAYIKQNPALIGKIKANPSLMLDLLTKPEFQPTFEDASDDEYWNSTSKGEQDYYAGFGSNQSPKTAAKSKGVMNLSPEEFKKAKERLPFLFQEPSPEDQRRTNASRDAANQQFVNAINNMGARNQAPSVSDPDAVIRQQQNLNKAFGTGPSDEAYRKNVDSSFRETTDLSDIKKLSGL